MGRVCIELHGVALREGGVVAANVDDQPSFQEIDELRAGMLVRLRRLRGWRELGIVRLDLAVSSREIQALE
jgi:hypothetical protein